MLCISLKNHVEEIIKVAEKMKKVICGWMVVIGMLLLQDQRGISAMQEKAKFYQLTYQMENVTGQIIINGFVVTEMEGKTGNGSAALNPWLIGENELKAELKKADPSKPGGRLWGQVLKYKN